MAQLAYDVTVRFCDRYIDRRSRTRDQMVQAARSGTQNIAEGSAASGTSKKFELKLTGVARTSLDELRLDYEDYLRHRGLELWLPDDPRRGELIARRCRSAEEVAAWVREVYERERGRGGAADGQTGRDGRSGRKPATASTARSESIPSTRSIPSISPKLSTYPALAANPAQVLIVVAISLLDRQLAAQAAAFEQDGGFTERLYRIRTARRHRPD